MSRSNLRLCRGHLLIGAVALLLLSGVALPTPAQQATGGAATPPAGSRTVPASGRYTEVRGFGDWFRRGGVFMYPLALCSIVGLAVIIERAVSLRRATTDTRRLVGTIIRSLRTQGIDAAFQACSAARGPVARILYSGLSRARGGPTQVERAIEAAGSIEVAFLQRGLLWLATVANVAPLLGFLGTVSGMIHAFATIAAADQITARLVASGIEEALITTEAGLCIAIPVQAFHNYFVGRIDRFITQMEEGALELVQALEDAAAPR